MANQLAVGNVRKSGQKGRSRETAGEIESKPTLLAVGVLVYEYDAVVQQLAAQRGIARARKLLQRPGRAYDTPRGALSNGEDVHQRLDIERQRLLGIRRDSITIENLDAPLDQAIDHVGVEEHAPRDALKRVAFAVHAVFRLAAVQHE